MNPNNLITTASFTPNSLQFPNAWAGHLPFAAWVIQEISPKIFVELGTHSGNSYFSFCQSVLEAGISTKCNAVDTWHGDEHAERYSEDVFDKVNAHNAEHYAGFSRLLRMTFDDAVTCFADESIELLHIDGLHTYEAVRHDFETWLPKLAPGAVVIFHDTRVCERDFGVWRLWEELQARYPSNLEFVHSHGLGVLQLNNAPDDKRLEWLQPNSPEKLRLINYFAALGSRQVERFELNELKQHTANLTQAVAEREGQIVNLNQAVAERDGQIVNLNQAVAERDGQLAALYNSRSWRITRPLHFVAHQMRRIRRVAEWAMPAIKRGSGRVAISGQIIPTQDSCEFDRNDYAEWIRRYDTLTDESRATMRDRIDNFVRKPLISVVMPTHNPKPEWLIEAIESIRKQIYPCWELCIADDASTDKAIRPILESYAREDRRIKVVFREKNGHVSAASNSALVLATGEWVALLDHDDLLALHALFWVVDAINQNPYACLIYSDEDKIDDSGRRLDPYFKCDWNVDLFYSQNMFSHLGVYRADLLNEIGGFREELEGSQDYDLALRCLERIEPKQIHHIPRVLYHWRMHAESTEKSGDAKSCALLAGERALNDHFQRQNVNARAELVGFGYRVHHVLPDVPPLVSLIIPTRNGLQLIRQCVESILKKTTYPNYEILIVDNGSDDPATLQYFKELQSDPRIRVVRDDRPFNYSALNNAAVKLARGEVVGLLNNDLEVISPEWLSEMVSHALRPGVGAVGARLWYPNNTLQHGGVVIGLGGVAGHSHKHLPQKMSGYFWRASLIQSFSAVTAACLVIRKSVYEEVGGFNEDDLQIAFNDIDFCLRVREAGYRNIWTPYAELYHHESATRGYEDTPERQARFAKEVQYMKQRWGDTLLNDPAYSPNLTLGHDDFSLAWPPRVELLHQST
jgi:glycosyltransferase involved in cell wall biosynthesis